MKILLLKILLTTSLISIVLTFSYGQQSCIEIEYGIGNYRMEDLKELNSFVQKDLNFNTELTSDFPVYPYFKASAFLIRNRNHIGLTFSFNSTGSRISASDYSGEYRFDNLLKAYAPGIFITTPFIEHGKLSVDGRLEGGIIFSKLKNNEYFSLYDSVYVNSDNNFKSINLYLEPGIQFSYPVYHFKVGFYAGYIIQSNKQGFYIDDPKNSQVMNPATQGALKPGWDGFRINVSLTYPLSHAVQ